MLAVSFTIRDRERGGRLFLERKRRWRTTCLRNEKNLSGFGLRDWKFCMNLVEAGIGTTGEETIKLAIIIKSSAMVSMKALEFLCLPLQGEADTGPRSLVLCGYPS